MKFFSFSTYDALSFQDPFNTYDAYNLIYPWITYNGDTVPALIQYYANLLILQYVGQPKAYATIQTQAAPFIMDNLPVDVMNGFEISTAVGVQLDVIAKYIGVSRNVALSTGTISLTDAELRTTIYLGIVRNSASSSLSFIQDLLHTYFPDQILVFDYSNMHMNYLINSSIGDQSLAKVFVKEGLLPKPMGVQLAVIIYAPVIDKFFGFRTYTLVAHNVSPLNTYDSYDTDAPFLNYNDALIL